MSNHIYSRVKIEPEEAMDKICNIIESMTDVPYGQETKAVVQAFYTEEEVKSPYNKGETEYPITEKGVNHGWLYDFVGTKWIEVGIDDDIRIETPYYIPDGFLIKLYSLCSEFENVQIKCSWYDETETEVGCAFIKDGIYTEDQDNLESDEIEDSAYYVKGDEDIEDVKNWILSQITEDSYLSKEEIEEKDEDELRDIFEQWKNEGKWDDIMNKWENIYSSCEEAIDTEDFKFPISKVKKIANNKNEMIEKCYPF